MEVAKTTIELAGAAYENKGPIKNLWDQLILTLQGRKSTIIFTGLTGVGKTVLLDRLAGKAYNEGYSPPGRSKRIEKTIKRIQKDKTNDDYKIRLVYKVIPGQQSQVRQEALDEVFSGKTNITGIVHVVSGGLPTIREGVVLQELKERGITDLATFRHYQLQEELSDLDETCKAIERYVIASRQQVWMIIVLTKIDLFIYTLEQELSFYVEASSPFVERLRLLQTRIGSLYFDWEIASVSSLLEDFNYNNEKIESLLKSSQQAEYLRAFLKKILDRC